MSDSEHETPSQWIPLKEAAASEPISSNARPSLMMDSMFLSVMESEEFDRRISVNVEDDDDSSKNQPKLAARETKAVNCLKFALLTMMLLTASVFAAVVYTYTRNEEVKDFQEAFVILSQQIEDAVQISAQNRLEAVGALGLQIQAHAHTSNETWPFVTVPFFEDRIYSMESLTDAFGVLLFPVVSKENRRAWETYSVANAQWIDDSYAAQDEMFGDSGKVPPASNETWFDVLWGQGFELPQNPDFSSGLSDRIFGGWDPNNKTLRGPYIYPERELYFPQWQAAPMSWYLQTTVNQNYAQFDDFYNSTILSMETGNAVMGVAWTDRIVPGFITTMLYPIYREIYREAGNVSFNVVAFLGADIYWRHYLEDVFHDDDARATVIINNNVGQSFTYSIHGDSVTFVGEGDLHDNSYNDMEETFVFGSHLGVGAIDAVSPHPRVFLDQEWVQYTFRIYPSKDLEESFQSKKPAVYTVVVLLVALTSAGLFFMYDFLVERRQGVVLRTAERSDAIVSSLFPKKVKEQLYQTSDDSVARGEDTSQPTIKSNKKEWSGQTMATETDSSERPELGKTQARASSTSLEVAVAGLQTAGNRKFDGPPIAEFYEEATVFFAGTSSLLYKS